MLCLVQKLRLNRIASRDADDLYEEFLIQHKNKSNESIEINTNYPLSEWMKSLVYDYTITVDKLINKSKGIITLYNKIRQNYARSNEDNSKFDKKKAEVLAQVSDIQAEIDNIETELMNISQLQNNFYEGKPLPNGLTPRKLNGSKIEFEQKRSQKQAQKESMLATSSIKTERDKLDKRQKKLGDKVNRLESNFSDQIDLLYQKIRKAEIKYNEQINYYWKKLCEYIQDINFEKNNQYHSVQNGSDEIAAFIKTFRISESTKQLKDIIPLCGKSLLSKADLFKIERIFINTTINPSLGIQYEV